MVTAMGTAKKLTAIFLMVILLATGPFGFAKELSNYLNSYYQNMGIKVLAYGFKALAGEHFKQLLASEPDNYEIRLLWTMILFDEGEYDKARAQVELLRQNPNADLELDVLEGRILQKLGQLPQAKACYQKAIAQDEEQALAQLGLAQLLALEGATREAIAAYETVIELSPERLDAYLELSQLQRGQGELEGAIATLKDGIAINRQWAPFHQQLAELYQELGKEEEAKVALERARQLQPELGDES